jgi:hypothetical protein
LTGRSPVRVERFAFGALLALVLVLGYVNWRLLYWQPEPAASVAPAPVITPAAANPAPRPGAQIATTPKDYKNILARPLFDSSRRPQEMAAAKPVPAPPKPAAAPFPADKFKLVGIMRSPNRSTRALLRTNATDPGNWIDEGGAIAGWAVVRIGEDRVELSANGVTGVVKLTAAAAATAVATTSQLAPPANPQK